MRIIKIEWSNNNSYAYRAMELLEPHIISSCFQYQFGNYDINDMAQELRLRLWQQLRNYNPQRASLRTWGNIVIKNKIKNIKRDSFRHKRLIQYFLSDLDSRRI